jgi:ATP-dependent Lhr-like helicase
VQPAGGEVYLESWCRQLLRRWGVVFRDLLRRETAAPAWHRLVPVFRTLERRGEIRGGRFVSGTSGEQYALPAAVDQLRAVRDPDENSQWIAVSGCDPLNLVGIVTGDEDRIPATSRSALILDNGRCVAVRRKSEVVFRQQVAAEQAAEMTRALHQARRPTATRLHVPRATGSGTREIAESPGRATI